MQQYLLVSLIYETKVTPITPLLRLINEHHCIIKSSKLLSHGDKQQVQMQVKGPWNEIVKLELLLSKTAKKWPAKILLERANKIPPSTKTIPYIIELYAPENTNALFEVYQFFTEQNIPAYDMSITPYFANPLGNVMSHIQLSIFVPENYAIAQLRENFVNLCDSLNLDAYLEPVHN